MVKEKREMGGSEAHHQYLSDFHECHSQLCSFVRFELEKFDQERMQQAFSIITQAQPMLRARVYVKADRYYFEIDDEIDDLPLIFIEKDDIRDLPKFIEKQLTFEIDKSHYQWRAYFFYSEKHNGKAIVLSWSHAIADGHSAAYFFDSLFRAYEGEEIEVLSLQEPVKKPSYFDYGTSNAAYKSLDFHNYTETGDLPRNFSPSKVHGHHDIPEAHRVTKCQFHKYASIEMLKAEAHHFGLKLNAFLGAAAVISLARAYNKKISIILVTTVDLRKRCHTHIPRQYIGHYIGRSLTYHMNISPESRLEEVAYHYHNQSVEAGHYKGFTFQDHLTIKELSRISDQNRPEGVQIPLALQINNLGELPFSGEYKWIKWKSFYRAQSLRRRSLPIKLSIHTFHKNLMVTYMSSEHVIPQKIMEEFIKSFEALLSLNS